MGQQRLGLIDNWLGHLRDIYRIYQEELQQMDEAKRFDRLCELNVIEQVANVTSSTIVQEAWDRGQEVAVHGWIYGIDNGLLTDLDVTVDREHGLANPR